MERISYQNNVWDGSGKATELCCQLRSVVGDRDALLERSRLRSTVACKTCRSNIQTAALQKARFEELQIRLVDKLEAVATRTTRIPAQPLPLATPARSPPTHLHHRPPEKRPLGSPLMKTGISPLTKRRLSDVSRHPQHHSTADSRSPRSGPGQSVARRELLFDRNLPSSGSSHAAVRLKNTSAQSFRSSALFPQGKGS